VPYSGPDLFQFFDQTEYDIEGQWIDHSSGKDMTSYVWWLSSRDSQPGSTKSGLLSCVGYVVDTVSDTSSVLEKTPAEDLEKIHCPAPNHIGLHLPYGKLRQQQAREEEMVRRLYNLRRLKLGPKEKMLPSLDTCDRDLGGNLMSGDVFATAFQIFHDCQAPKSVIAELLRCDTIPNNTKSIAPGRRLATLASEKLALVPASAHPGDKICFVQSCAVPFVVREEDGDDHAAADKALIEKLHWPYRSKIGHFKVVGDCFVDGLMYWSCWNTLPGVDLRERGILVFH
jgi:hypothetical protein